LKRCVIDSFETLFRPLGKFIEAFDCDLVLVSGKPSELPPLKKLVERHLPLPSQRIIFTKGAPVGSWYPLSTDGIVHDAKSVTVAGAALYQAIKNGLFPGWAINRTISPHFFQRHFWGLMPVAPRPGFGKLLLNLEQEKNTCEIRIKDRIGRSLLSSEARPEPVYQLLWRDRNRFRGGRGHVLPILRVTLERAVESPPEGSNEPTIELLDIVDVQGEYEGRPVSLGDVELKFCTLDSDEFWIDAGTFDVEWPEA